LKFVKCADGIMAQVLESFEIFWKINTGCCHITWSLIS